MQIGGVKRIWLGSALFGAALWLAGGPAVAAVVGYDISQETAHIAFHTLVARVVPVDGQFRRFSGHIAFDTAQPSALRIAVTVDDSEMDVPFGGAATLRSPAYFDSARFPAILFRSDSVQVQPGGGFSILGRLSIRGAEQPALLTGTIDHATRGGIPVLRVTAHAMLDRTRFGMVADRPLIADRVTLTITTTLRAP